MEDLFNVNQAAYILKVHPLTIRRYIREGKLKAVRAGGNVRIMESQLIEFNKDLVPRPRIKTAFLKEKPVVIKTFTVNDPLFKLKGLGAHIELSSSR